MRFRISLFNRDILRSDAGQCSVGATSNEGPGMGARSVRQEQRDLAAALRAERKTWVQVATAFRERYHVNLRAGLRMARDWSQRDAADHWNQRWPDDPKTDKNFSYWELWPSRTGHAPSLDVLAHLAELYECSVADLVADCANFRSRDDAHSDSAWSDVAQLAVLLNAGDAGEEATEDLKVRLEHADMQEIAALATEWSRRLGGPDERRSLLLKLSAGLSLAVASSELTGPTSSDAPTTALSTAADGFEGIWHSRYVYRSKRAEEDLVDEHYLVARQTANKLIAQSVPHSTGSRVRIELALDPPVATGSWTETTAPDGYYRGATYHGALQLVIDPSRRHMSGRWLGFGRDFTVNTGEWTLTWEEGSTAKSVQRRYHERV